MDTAPPPPHPARSGPAAPGAARRASVAPSGAPTAVSPSRSAVGPVGPPGPGRGGRGGLEATAGDALPTRARRAGPLPPSKTPKPPRRGPREGWRTAAAPSGACCRPGLGFPAVGAVDGAPPRQGAAAPGERAPLADGDEVDFGGEVEHERRAAADFALDGELAAHRSCELARDVQPESGSRLHVIVIETFESIEDALEMLAGMPGPSSITRIIRCSGCSSTWMWTGLVGRTSARCPRGCSGSVRSTVRFRRPSPRRSPE